MCSENIQIPALKLLNYVDQVLMSAQSANYCCGQFRAINSSPACLLCDSSIGTALAERLKLRLLTVLRRL